jgi:hypothetical protein
MDDQADLSHLADIVLPAPISWWPPALGWWIAGAALLVALAILARHAHAQHRRNAYRRAAIAELSAIASMADGASLTAVSAILKRAALVAYPRRAVASLTGAAWLSFLDKSAGTDAFTKGPARGLENGIVEAPFADGEAIRKAARHWIARHGPEA